MNQDGSMDLVSAERFFVQISNVSFELPVSPDILGDIFRQASDESYVSLDSIAYTISRDQGLTARVLAKANSAYYGLQGRISSVSRATSLLGLEEIRKIILFITISSIGQKIDQKNFNINSYWEHQCFVASMAAQIGAMNGRTDSGELFVMGMLHDIGKLMIALYQPRTWNKIKQLAAAQSIDDYSAEQKYWGIDHATAGTMVLRRWNFPEAITEAINWHHSPERADQTFREQARILSLANIISHHMENKTKPEQTETLSRLNLTPEQAMEAARDITSSTALSDLKSLLAN